MKNSPERIKEIIYSENCPKDVKDAYNYGIYVGFQEGQLYITDDILPEILNNLIKDHKIKKENEREIENERIKTERNKGNIINPDSE